MAHQERSTFLTDHLDQILIITNSIAKIAVSGEYIYRGEPKYFDEISSNLYRQAGGAGSEGFSVTAVQQGILEGARKYTTETGEIEILSELQHFGGKTNLIDFTTDYLTALFFACDGFPLEDGRVVLLQRTGAMAQHISEPRRLTNRAIVQKSIFVIPPTGVVEADHMICVPKDIKQPLLEYLHQTHSISTETIYNDLHGFIRQQNLHAAAYRQLHLGITYHGEENANYQHAIDHYTEAIALNPRLAQAYCGRGGAFLSNGEYGRAILDFDRAVEIEEDHSCAYANRGRVHMWQADYDKAIEDFDTAIYLNRNLDNEVSSQANFYRGTVYLLKDHYDLAILDFDKVIDWNLPPGAAQAYNRRGDAYLYKQELDRAIDDFNQAIQLAPEMPDNYCSRGIAHVYKREYNRAIRNFDRAIAADDGHPCAYHNRGVARLFLAEWEESRRDLDTAKTMGVDIIAAFQGDFESIAEFEQRNDIKIPADIAAMLGG